MNMIFKLILLFGLLLELMTLPRLPAYAVDPKVGAPPPQMQPAELQSLTLNPASIVGGVSVRGTVTMTGAVQPGGVTVSLASADRRVGVPAFGVKVVGSNATFTVTTSPVASSTVVTITASYRRVTRSAALTILPIAVSSLTCSPSTVYGGTTVTCRVNLNGPAPAGAVANLDNSAPAVATVPPTVAITETSPGKPPLATPYSYGMFTVTTRPVAAPASVRITAWYGTSQANATVNVSPPVLSSLTCPSSVTGGNPVTCRATLSGPAPEGGVSVSLTSSNTQVLQVPKAVHITQATRDFTANTSAVANPTSVTITGSYGENRTATVEVRPPAVVVLADLFVPGFELTTTGGQPYPDTGFDFVLRVTVSNHPDVKGASAPSTLRVNLNCNQPMSGYPKSWTKSIPALAPGASAKIPFTVPGLNRGSPNNRPTYSFTMCADSGNVVQETNENNNCAVPYSITQH